MKSKKLDPRVTAMYIAPNAGEGMEFILEVEAITNAGLKGDRYCDGKGSFNKGKKGNRQVTFMNAKFFDGTGFHYSDSRRNIITKDVELMWLIGREFQIGEARFKGVKYCDPCNRPNELMGSIIKDFKMVFFDQGGLVAEVIQGGIIKNDDKVILPHKAY